MSKTILKCRPLHSWRFHYELGAKKAPAAMQQRPFYIRFKSLVRFSFQPIPDVNLVFPGDHLSAPNFERISVSSLYF